MNVCYGLNNLITIVNIYIRDICDLVLQITMNRILEKVIFVQYLLTEHRLLPIRKREREYLEHGSRSK